MLLCELMERDRLLRSEEWVTLFKWEFLRPRVILMSLISAFLAF